MHSKLWQKQDLADESNSFDTLEQYLAILGTNQTMFEAEHNRYSINTHVVLERQINDVWISQYSKQLLKC